MDLGGLVGGAIGAITGLIGQNQTNQKNWDISQANNEWSAQQYATRYQTTVQDLTKAGLNPMLAYSNGPGNAPVAQQTAPMQNSLGTAVEGFNKTRATSAQAALQTEQLKQVESQTVLNSAQTAKSLADAEVSKEQARLTRVDADKRESEIPKVIQETQTSQELARAYIQQAGASAAQAQKAYEEIKNISQQNQNLRASNKQRGISSAGLP